MIYRGKVGIAVAKYRIFTKDKHTIIWGNALDIIDAEIEDGSVQLIFADPPYNIGKHFANFHDKWASDADYAKWCEIWLNLCIRKLSPSGSLYVMTSTQCMPYLDLYLRNRIHIISRIVWHYDSSGVQAKSKFGSMYEPILYCVKNPKNYTFNAEAITVEARTGAIRNLIDYRKSMPAPYNSVKIPGNVWNFPRVRYRMSEYENHPTQKPENLLKRVILASSNLGDLVLDPFSGTFTTSAVAKHHGRDSIGIEQAKEFVKIGLRRLSIANELDGEKLRPIKKSYVRKNSLKNQTNPNQIYLFDDK